MTQISKKLRITTLAVLFSFCAMIMASTSTFAAPTPAPPPPASPLASKGASVFVQAADATGSFSGILKITSFTTSGNQIMANGTLTGTLTKTGAAALAAPTTVTQQVSLPVISATASCPILSLTLGPLDLTILGLNVTLNQVVLNITAIPGPGNLLGNLLCDVANLLNGGGLSGLLTNLVNDLNAILAGLGL
jgi:hypothetical protein